MSLAAGKLGRYQIIREIARSNDIVYEAWDPALNRRVALKELAVPPSATPSQAEDRIQRFEREARAAGTLTHPNIVTIYEVGCEGDRHFIAMEYLEGESLRQRLDAVGALGETEAIRIIAQVLEGLDHAHDKGIVHRDIKPDNIHILPDGRVKITDLGIARLTFEPKLTVTGQIFGTPSYMSPEQVHGGDVDVRSDVWSVGVVLYEAISGAKPFTGSSVIAIAHSVLHDQPPDAPGASYGAIELIRTALNKSADSRFANAGVMLQALQNISRIPSAPPAQQPAGTPYSPPPRQPAATPQSPPSQTVFVPAKTAPPQRNSLSALGWLTAGLVVLILVVIANENLNKVRERDVPTPSDPSNTPTDLPASSPGIPTSPANETSSVGPPDVSSRGIPDESPDRFPETATRLIPRRSAETWSDYDIQYALTEIVVRHGYDLVNAEARQVFSRNRGKHYNPIPGRTLAEAEREMTSIEARNYNTLVSIRDERRRIGTWQDPWSSAGTNYDDVASRSQTQSQSQSSMSGHRAFSWSVPVGWTQSHSISRHPYHRWEISPRTHVKAFVDVLYGDNEDEFLETLRQEARWKANGEHFTRIALERSTFQGRRSALRIYEKAIDGRWVRRLVHYFHKNGNGYAVGFQSPPEYWNEYERTFRAIEDSLVIH